MDTELTRWQQEAAGPGSLTGFRTQFDKIHGRDISRSVLDTKVGAVAQAAAAGGRGGTACTPSAAGPRCTQLRPDPAQLLEPKITPGLKNNESLEEA